MSPAEKLAHYEKLKYRIEAIEDEDAWVLSVPDLPGCVAYGDTIDEAMVSLRSVKRLWVKGKLDAGLPVPEPTEDLDEYSGKFVLRISRGLHKALQREAKTQRVSLNQYVGQVLAERHAVVNLEQMVQSAIQRSVCSATLYGVLAAPAWQQEEGWWNFAFEAKSKGSLHSSSKPALALSNEDWGQTFKAYRVLVGSGAPKSYEICMNLKEPNYYGLLEDNAPRKAKTHARSG